MHANAPVLRKAEFLNKLEAILELDEAALTGEEELAGLPSWDSLTLMGFIAMVDETFGARFSGKQIMACKTVDDLMNLLGDRVAA
ncbi:MAG TPA: acyl carrier protein [Pirellulales bacterium]|nr:acyl carrier protein [Pirellulales bacterium]